MTQKITIEDAKRELLGLLGYEYKDYIETELAGDFCVDLIKALIRLKEVSNDH